MKAIYSALFKAKETMPSIQKTSVNPFFKSKYASLESILPVVEPILKDNGLVITSNMNGHTLITAIVHCESGEKIESSFELPALQDLQKMGSAITYARRYSIVALLNLNVDEDVDGNQPKENGQAKKPETKKEKTPYESALEKVTGTEGNEALTTLEKRIKDSTNLSGKEKLELITLIKGKKK